jgi:hypothetical protein
MKVKAGLTCAALGALVSSVSTSASAEFLKDSKATLSMRNLYVNGDNRDGTASPSKSEEWAQGFMLNYQSGFTEGTVGFGLDLLSLTGVTLDTGGGSHAGGTIVPDDGNSGVGTWSRFGATAKARIAQSELRLGTLMPKLPILVANDGRLLPQTYQGGQIVSKDIAGLTLTGGMLNQVTGRASTDRTGMSVAGSAQDSNKFTFAGLDYNVTKGLKAQYYFANLDDFYNQHFLGLLHVVPLSDNSSLTTDLRYFNTQSSGKNGSAGGRGEGYKVGGYTKNGDGEIDNNTWSLFSTYALGAHSFTLGYQSVSEDSNFVQLNQSGLTVKGAGGASVYLFTDKLIQNFTRAGERTAFGQYGYDFAGMGIPGLRASVSYLKGTNIQTASSGNQSEWERDITLDYVVQSGTFKGVGLAWRNGMARSEATRDYDQNRLIVSYSIPLL